MTVYLDLVFLLNFLVDFFLLLGTNRLSGFPAGYARCAMASLIGGLYGSFCILRRFAVLSGYFFRALCLILIGFTAFGFRCSSLKRCSLFLLLSFALGGFSVNIGRVNFTMLLLSGCFLVLLCKAAFGESAGGRNYLPMTLTYGNSTVSMIALQDSGNTLRDPVTGEQVFLISEAIATSLTGLTPLQLADPLGTASQRPIPGLRLIPFHSVGCSYGMLLALRFDGVKIGSCSRSAIVAFANNGLKIGDGCQALAPAYAAV